jgi:hypothetical protein
MSFLLLSRSLALLDSRLLISAPFHTLLDTPSTISYTKCVFDTNNELVRAHLYLSQILIAYVMKSFS